MKNSPRGEKRLGVLLSVLLAGKAKIDMQ